ncbi:ornithine cyclodeaminase [Wenyingzhuangia fucanilytica]|uniref:Ornithine cyclodeaminase n=1 Tax=Wenyingzhuangia fucanilytica TaxID=1790137 RepID=A0A1B1Y5K7_9FLAO|nr:ornithine cyclodeaminase family protein [Wenyingzhuangia fucanilytica]ANW96071.1 ornithine cyclodeaminase [Wenyingzhuangia fucanilytica]
MKPIVQIDNSFIESNTIFRELIEVLRNGFANNKTLIPTRHHHDFPNPEMKTDSTVLLMPAWSPGETAGVKIITVSPKNSQFDLPSIQGTYIYLDATNGSVKAIIEAKSLTAKRTAAASALASSYLSRKDSSSLLMIGTGALSKNLIQAHASVRDLKKVYVWGRSFKKAQAICEQLKNEDFTITPIQNIEEKISEVDIISSATLSKTPLILGKHLKKGQHVDLVGAYKKDMREADDETILKSSVYVDSFEGGLKENGDILIPLQTGIIKESDIKADLFGLTSEQKQGRSNVDEITVFKSVGHALEDLVAADYYYEKYIDSQ